MACAPSPGGEEVEAATGAAAAAGAGAGCSATGAAVEVGSLGTLPLAGVPAVGWATTRPAVWGACDPPRAAIFPLCDLDLPEEAPDLFALVICGRAACALAAAATFASPTARCSLSKPGIGAPAISGQPWLSARATIARPIAAVAPSNASDVLRVRSSSPSPKMLVLTEDRSDRCPCVEDTDTSIDRRKPIDKAGST